LATMSLIMPRRPKLADFTLKLKEAFQRARGGNVEVIESDAKPNEIALISLNVKTGSFSEGEVRPAAEGNQRASRALGTASRR